MNEIFRVIMNTHHKEIQIIILESTNDLFLQAMNIIKRNQCQVMMCEYLQDFKVILLQISGTYLNVTQCEKKMRILCPSEHLRTQSPNQDEIGKLHYHIECRSLSQLEGYCNIVEWLASLDAGIESSQLISPSSEKYEFQISFSINKHTHISDMKLSFYEICDDHGLDGSIELA